MRVQTARLLIRDLQEGDRESVRAWRRDPDVTRYLDNPTGADADGWFDAALRANVARPRQSHDCAIVLLRSGEVIGWLRVGSSIDTRPGEYVASYALRPEHWNHGYLTEALKAVLDASFGELGAQRVYAQAYRANVASTRVMEKAGMRFAGPAPSAAPILGESVRYTAERATRRRSLASRLRGNRKRIGLAVVVGLLVLLAAPVGISVLLDRLDRPSAPDDPRLLSWQPRGDLAEDRDLLDEVAEAWRAAVPRFGVAAPGRDVYLLWAGTIGGGRVAIVQAIGTDGDPYVAQIAERGKPARWRLDGSQRIDGRPLALVVRYDGNLDLPMLQAGAGADLVQLLVAPTADGAESPKLFRRVRGGANAETTWEPLAVDQRGMSRTWLHVDGSSPDGTVIAMVTHERNGRDSVRTLAASPYYTLPRQPTIRLADPTWGPMTAFDELTYDDARAAGSILGEDHVDGDVALLAVRTDRTRAAVLETRSRGVPRAVLVAWDRNRVACVGEVTYPDIEDRSFVAAGCVDPQVGRTVIAVVPKPGTARYAVTDLTGGVVMASRSGAPGIVSIDRGQPVNEPFLVTAYNTKGVGIDRSLIRINGTPPPPR